MKNFNPEWGELVKMVVTSVFMKILLLGLSGVSKSTIAGDLAKVYKLKLLEADDEISKLNGGVWPSEEEVIDRYFDEINPQVAKLESIVYVISWLEPPDISAFYDAGFVLVELHATPETLKTRKRARDTVVDEERLLKNFKLYFEVMRNPTISKLFSVSVDTTALIPTEVLQTIIEALNLRTLREA